MSRIVYIDGKKYEKQPVPERLMWDVVCHGCACEDKGMAMCQSFPRCTETTDSGEMVKFYIFKEIKEQTCH